MNEYQRNLRKCESRWDAMEPVLSMFGRPFTVLDVGANCGYFPINAARKYGAIPIMVEKDRGCIKEAVKDYPKVVCMHRKATHKDLHELATSEHFDIAMCMSVLHHVTVDWKEFLEEFLHLADYKILEYPTPADTVCKNAVLASEQYEELRCREQRFLAMVDSFEGVPDRRILSLFSMKRTTLYNRSWPGIRPQFSSKLPTDRVHTVDSSTKSKHIVKRGEYIPWVHGISLWSFINMNGVNPPRELLIEQMRKLDIGGHGDIRPWNMVIDGENVHLVDRRDPKPYRKDDRKALDEVIDWMAAGGSLS